MSTSTTYDFRNNLLVDRPRAASQRRRAVDAAWRPVGLQPATHVHPFAVGAAAAGYAWFLLVCWVVFAADPQMVPTLLMCTFISVIMLGLLAGAGLSSPDVTPWMRGGRSWAEFLDGRVDTFTGPMTGRQVFAHLAGLSFVLALAATALGIIIASSHL